MINELIGLRLDDAKKRLEGKNVTVKDFSRPDKYHKDLPQSLRVVKVTQNENEYVLFVAGFVDEILTKE